MPEEIMKLADDGCPHACEGGCDECRPDHVVDMPPTQSEVAERPEEHEHDAEYDLGGEG